MGWQRRRRLIEYRREILRKFRRPNASTHSYADRDPNPNLYAYSNAYADAMHGKMCTNTEASPYPGTAPVICR